MVVKVNPPLQCLSSIKILPHVQYTMTMRCRGQSMSDYNVVKSHTIICTSMSLYLSGFIIGKSAIINCCIDFLGQHVINQSCPFLTALTCCVTTTPRDTSLPCIMQDTQESFFLTGKSTECKYTCISVPIDVSGYQPCQARAPHVPTTANNACSWQELPSGRLGAILS